jgi:hypothetical protein
VHFECAQRELIVRVVKITDGRARRAAPGASKPESFGIWMSRKHQLGIEVFDELHGLEAVRSLADDLDVRELRQMLAQDGRARVSSSTISTRTLASLRLWRAARPRRRCMQQERPP